MTIFNKSVMAKIT